MRFELCFPLPWQLVVIFLLFELAFVVICSFGFALLLNWILKTPLQHYIVSTVVISLIVYIITVAILLDILPPLRWVNTVPQDTRTWLWDHIQFLAAGVALVCVSVWQSFIRMKHKIAPTSSV